VPDSSDIGNPNKSCFGLQHVKLKWVPSTQLKSGGETAPYTKNVISIGHSAVLLFVDDEAM